MAIADIDQLCQAMCELSGIPSPRLTPNAHGALAATLRLHGVDIVMQQLAAPNDDCVYLSADLGEVPEDSAGAAWRILIEANLYMIGDAEPRFSRHPSRGRARLQWACPLDQTDASDFHRRIAAMATVVLEWRNGYFLGDPEAAHRWYTSAFRDKVPEDSAHVARDRFDALYKGIREALGEADVEQPPAAQMARVFALRRNDVNMVAFQSLDSGMDRIFLALSLGRPTGGIGLDDLTALMDLNYRLATVNRWARIGLPPAAGEFLLVQGHPLAHAEPESILGICGLLVDIAGPLVLPPYSRTRSSRNLAPLPGAPARLVAA